MHPELDLQRRADPVEAAVAPGLASLARPCVRPAVVVGGDPGAPLAVNRLGSILDPARSLPVDTEHVEAHRGRRRLQHARAERNLARDHRDEPCLGGRGDDERDRAGNEGLLHDVRRRRCLPSASRPRPETLSGIDFFHRETPAPARSLDRRGRGAGSHGGIDAGAEGARDPLRAGHRPGHAGLARQRAQPRRERRLLRRGDRPRHPGRPRRLDAQDRPERARAAQYR